ncbi:MAG: GNAT family N-acetyltransferase [Solobacterium sp.]|uniref:GNAT family N-acetyltransferase n=1 Tax=Solobacterium sp. TaxID=2060878 RepID=UPI001CADA092|nr:GNAT family N-acetyltransferase [Solobacterium sp.]MBF1089498.1 GNAT family N-acetyltransferase [Solobacterium sp.]
MLEEITSLDEYEAFIKDICSDACYVDPHYLYDSNNLYGAFEKKDQHVYVNIYNGSIDGIFVLLILPTEKYIEMIIGLSKSEHAYNELFEYLEKNYKGYRCDFVINPKNILLKNILTSKNAIFENEQQRMIARSTTNKEYTLDVQLYSKRWKQEYIDIHVKETYWTAEKVLSALDRFRVFLAIHQEQLVGYLDVTYAYKQNEPYSLIVLPEYQNLGYEQALLSKAIQMNGINTMMTLVDVNAKEEIRIYEEAGFELIKGQNSVFVTITI